MASKSVLAEFQCRILKRPHEGDGSNGPKSVGSGELVFTLAPNEAAPGVQPSKKHKSKKVAKENTIIIDP